VPVKEQSQANVIAILDSTSNYTSFAYIEIYHDKRKKCIDGNIYIYIQATYTHQPPSSQPFDLGTVSDLFYLTFIPTEHTIQSYLATNNEEDTLRQSQLLHTTDMEEFLYWETYVPVVQWPTV
jgi:hypothetical protein